MGRLRVKIISVLIFAVLFFNIIEMWHFGIGYSSSISNTTAIPIGQPFGMNHQPTDDQNLQLADSLGIQIDRIGFNMDDLIINSTYYDNSSQMAQVESLTEYNVTILGIIGGGQIMDNNILTPSNISYWFAFLNQTIYTFQNFNVYWELWNEPNLGVWSTNESEFFYFLNATAEFIHEYYPNQKILFQESLDLGHRT